MRKVGVPLSLIELSNGEVQMVSGGISVAVKAALWGAFGVTIASAGSSVISSVVTSVVTCCGFTPLCVGCMGVCVGCLSCCAVITAAIITAGATVAAALIDEVSDVIDVTTKPSES